jgi:hypothetical protein
VDGQHDQADGGDDHADVGGDVVVRGEGTFEVGVVVVEHPAQDQHGEHGEGEHEGEHHRLAHEQLQLAHR